MTNQTKALFAKEWIKLRRMLWVLPFFVLLAVVDSLLILKAIERNHGDFGLWVTIISKTPPFVAQFLTLGMCGWLIGLAQSLPECKGKRLRILFHTPVNPVRIISVMLITGCGLLAVASVVAVGSLAGVMQMFNLPWEIARPVLLTVVPWLLLCFAQYFATVAFFAAQSLPLKGLIIACGYGAYHLLGSSPMYGMFEPSLWWHALFVVGFVPLVFFAFLSFLGRPSGKGVFGATRLASLVLVCLCLSAFLPGLYWRTVMPEHPRQGMFYSPVRQQFVMHSLEKVTDPTSLRTSELKYSLEDGSALTDRQYKQSLPFLYARDLIKWGMFPSRIQGKYVAADVAPYAWNYKRFSPTDWNAAGPMLHMLMDAEPEGAKLELPDDMFRVSADGTALEFLHPEDGSIDADKSERFTKALARKGFVFPVLAFGGNPTDKKAFDAGYFFVDATNTLFQLQMVQGEPKCVNSGFSIPGRVRLVAVDEKQGQQVCAYVVTDDAFYTVKQDNLAVQALPVNEFAADDTSFILWSDPLGVSTISKSITNLKTGTTGLAMNTGQHVVQSFTRPVDHAFDQAMDTRRAVASFLFPVVLSQTLPGSTYVHLMVDAPDVLWAAALGSALSLIGFVGLRRWLKMRIQVQDCALVLAFGPVALLATSMADARTLFGLKTNSL